MKSNKYNFILFLLGMFAMTEIYIGGFSPISEIVIFCIAPFVFINDFQKLRQDGFLPVLWLLALTLLGCCIASYVNHTAAPSFLRGVGAIYGTLGAIVCTHRFLRDDFGRVRWFFVGYSISFILNIFIFQRGSERHGYDIDIMSAEAMEGTLNSVLFWAERLPHWLYTPIRGWYIETPMIYSIPVALVVVVVALFGSGGSGRAAAFAALCSLFLLLVGGKTVSKLSQLRKHILVIIAILGLVAYSGKQAYEYLAESGALGEAGQKKLEQQTKHGKGALAILMAGRSEFFAGIYCAMKNPIVGYGPWAIDNNGLAGEFLAKYGTHEDYDLYIKYQMSAISRNSIKQAVIPSHSCIVGFWTWYGIFGLLLWLYILRLYWKTFTKYFVIYPPWFGCIATILPLAVWDAFFSPYGNRVMMGLFFSMCLFLKAMYEKRLPIGGINGINFKGVRI